MVRESNLASVSFKLRSVEWLIRAYLQAILNGDILSSVRLRGALLLQLYVGGGPDIPLNASPSGTFGSPSYTTT